jgi:hypothetical protein
MLTSGVMLLHGNALPHTAARTPAMLEHFNWELFDHPLYSPDLAPSELPPVYLPAELVAMTALHK